MLVTLDGNTAAAVIKAFKRRLKGAPRPAKADRPPRGSSKVAKPHLLERGPESPRKIGNFDSPQEGLSALPAAVIKGASLQTRNRPIQTCSSSAFSNRRGLTCSQVESPDQAATQFAQFTSRA